MVVDGLEENKEKGYQTKLADHENKYYPKNQNVVIYSKTFLKNNIMHYD